MISFSKLGNMGRLGNQLFQIGAAISLALRNNDIYVFPSWKYESSFNLYNCFHSNIKPTHLYNEPFFHYQEIPYINTTDQVLDLSGFFQSYKYFQEHEWLIKSLLTPKNGLGMKWGVTSIHVRHGDYLNLTREYEQLDMDYYNEAMSIVDSDRYLIVSDDIQWCRRNFVGEKFHFSEADEITDLNLQISCEHNIISNSSFSWWGGFLNKNPSKTVIAPGKWFGPALQHDTKDLIPKNWKVI